jgi:hypothetical protein
MRLITCHPAASGVWAGALFASVLQCSDNPGAGQVREAVAAAVRAYGGLGCVQRVAGVRRPAGGRGGPDALGSCGGRRVVRLTAGAGAAEPAKTGHAVRGQPPAMAAGRVMKRIRAGRPGIRRERAWTEETPAGLRDPAVVRAKALTRARRTGSSRASQGAISGPGANACPGERPVRRRRTGR